nr:MAG TPA: hypothetical protein [Caudoviricetes sp.]
MNCIYSPLICDFYSANIENNSVEMCLLNTENLPS